MRAASGPGELGGIPDGFVSIHSVWQTPADLDLYRQRGVSINYNPEPSSMR